MNPNSTTIHNSICLTGPAGCGKTSAGVARMVELSQRGEGGILIYVPQRSAAAQYYEAIESLSGVLPEVVTLGGLAKRMVELFWPLVVEKGGFGEQVGEPVFLTLETAQYYLAQIVEPMRAEGLFSGVTIHRNRLYTQILDNLNKAALNGYGMSMLAHRLHLAAGGSSAGPIQMYDDAILAAQRFRALCLKNGLLDFSLQLSLFLEHLWVPDSPARRFLIERYRHIIVDNLEETTPVEHDLLRSWLPEFETSMLIYDEDGGFRVFLGADPDSAREVTEMCPEQVRMEMSFHPADEILGLAEMFRDELGQGAPGELARDFAFGADGPIRLHEERFIPEVLDWVASETAQLVHEEGISPGQIVIAAPFLTDVLRYSLTERLTKWGIAARSHRPSRPLGDEPVSQALFTLAALAHPEWQLTVSKFDVAYSLMQSLAGIDLVRAQLLSEYGFDSTGGRVTLKPFDAMPLPVRDRISYNLGDRYEQLREWIERYQAESEALLDHFWARLFGERLAQPGFGLHGDLAVGEIASNLIDSARDFRWMNEAAGMNDAPDGKVYVQMARAGLIAAQYLRSWQDVDVDAVLLAPAYTFLMRNQTVGVQFWLDVGSHGWHRRIFQPVTHPHVLNRNWPLVQPWSDRDEEREEKKALFRLVNGLLRRCRGRVYLVRSEISESGMENAGLLLETLQSIYQGTTSGHGGQS
jgi:hypothetical protein